MGTRGVESSCAMNGFCERMVKQREDLGMAFLGFDEESNANEIVKGYDIITDTTIKLGWASQDFHTGFLSSSNSERKNKMEKK